MDFLSFGDLLEGVSEGCFMTEIGRAVCMEPMTTKTERMQNEEESYERSFEIISHNGKISRRHPERPNGGRVWFIHNIMEN
jgi:hypothetical protein